MRTLQKSVSLFSTIIISSYYAQHAVYHHLYTALLLFGLANHALDRRADNSKNAIHVVDTTLAHATFAYTVYDSYPVTFMNISLCNTFMLFALEYIFPKHDEILHLLIHIHTTMSMNIYLLFYCN